MKKLRLQITRLEIVAFVAGMAILTFELTASRIVAPYIGDTVYSWTSIIGVILAALAFGYSQGGKLADARKDRTDIIFALLLAAVLIVLVNILKDMVLAWIADQPIELQLQALLASLYLFALPTFMLGLIAPYAARLSIESVKTSGRHLSRVDAAGTLGSLAGTFLTGYVLFSLVGTRNLLTCISLALVVATFVLELRRHILPRVALIAVIILCGLQSPKPLISGFVKEIDTTYNRIIIRDTELNGHPIRVYQTAKDGLQSGIYLNGSKDLVFPYTRAFAATIDLTPTGGSDYLVIGGGAFTFPEFLAKKLPQATIDAVEIDPQLFEISRNDFAFDQPDNLNIIHTDGREYLNREAKVYDAIYLDAFGSVIPPFQLFTQEAAMRVSGSLKPGGILVVNIISAITGNDAKMLAYITSTFQSVFPYIETYTLHPRPAETRQNITMIASKQPLDTAKIANDPKFYSTLKQKLDLNFDASKIMTDDFAPMEHLGQ